MKKKTLMPKLIVAVLLVAVATYAAASYGFDTTSNNTLKTFSSYQELSDFLKSHYDSYGDTARYLGTAVAAQETAAPTTSGSDKSQDFSQTNVQVAGVDEADITKTDGEYIYTIADDEIVIVDAVPAEDSGIVSRIKFDGLPSEIFVSDDRLVVIGNEGYFHILPVERSIAIDLWPPIYSQPKTIIQVYDISDKTSPVLTRNITIDGNYVDSRLVDGWTYVISSYPASYPDVVLPTVIDNGRTTTVQPTEIQYIDSFDSYYQYTSILPININDDAVSSPNVVLMGGSQNIFVSSKNIYVTYQNLVDYGAYYYRLVDDVIVPNSPADVVADIDKIKDTKLSDSQKYYTILQLFNNYLQTVDREERNRIQEIMQDRMLDLEEEIQREMQSTIVHKISFDNGNVEYVTNSKVPGTVLNQFSMDESDGYFRIATTINNFVFRPIPLEGGVRPESTTPDSTNNLYVLDSSLNIVGKIENIAPDERIYSARFIGDRAYMVTFKQVDPLFVIDLSDPTNPQVIGSLKIPGFSEYLHPYDENHIIGVGRSVSDSDGRTFVSGLKLALFDVADPSSPKELDTFEIGGAGSYSEVLYDHKALLFSREKNLLMIPATVSENYVQKSEGAYVFTLDLENGFDLKGIVSHKTSEFDYGSVVRRSLYIGDVLYTISYNILKANLLSDLSEISSVRLSDSSSEGKKIPSVASS